MSLESVIENLIRKAQQEGKFDNLRGAGRPLSLEENPFEDPAMALANQMLKGQGFRPDWLEADLAQRDDLARAEQSLARARDWRAAELAKWANRADADAIQQRALVAHEWSLAQERFRDALNEINKNIFTLNLKVPNTRFQRAKLNVDEALQKIIAGQGAAQR